MIVTPNMFTLNIKIDNHYRMLSQNKALFSADE